MDFSRLLHGFLKFDAWIPPSHLEDNRHWFTCFYFCFSSPTEIFFCSWRLNWILVVTRPVNEAGALFRTFILMQIKGHFCTRPWRNSNPVLHSKELLSLAKNNFTLNSMFFCEEILSVAMNNLLLRTFLSSSSSGVGRRESRRINFALKLELLRYFIIGCRCHHFFPTIL